jgi:hypothetical protein
MKISEEILFCFLYRLLSNRDKLINHNGKFNTFKGILITQHISDNKLGISINLQKIFIYWKLSSLPLNSSRITTFSKTEDISKQMIMEIKQQEIMCNLSKVVLDAILCF